MGIMAAPHVKLPTFAGRPREKAETWFGRFKVICKTIYGYNHEKIRAMFPIYLSDQAAAWYNSLETGVRELPDELLRHFLTRFDGSDAGLALNNLRQRSVATVSEFFTRYLDSTNDQGMPKPWLISTFVRGLKADIRHTVAPQHMPTLEEARKAAIRAENSITEEIEVAAFEEREQVTVPRMREMVSDHTTLLQCRPSTCLQLCRTNPDLHLVGSTTPLQANTYQTRKPMVKVRVNFIQKAEIISFAIFVGKRVMSPIDVHI